MKNYFFSNSLLFLILIFSIISCGKKSSDSPSPAPAPATPTAVSKPTAPTNLTTTKPAEKGDGTVRTTPTVITSTSITVQGPDQQRDAIKANGKESDLNELLGPNSQIRGEGTSNVNKGFGWYISDVTVNGIKSSTSTSKLFFFNIDQPGIYWDYDFNTQNWNWGTWAVDDSMNYLALDYSASTRLFAETYEIVNITPNRLVLRSINTTDDILIGLNGYDLTDNAYYGQVQLSACQKSFTGDWRLYELYDADLQPVQFDPSTSLSIKTDGTYSTLDSSGTDVGNWIMNEIDCDPNTGLGTSELIDTYYDTMSYSYVSDTYQVSLYGTSSNGKALMSLTTANGGTLIFEKK